MPKQNSLVRLTDAPVELALVLVCEKCGRRVADSKKNPSHHLVSKLKRMTKNEFGKGAVRAVLTSCLDLCPDQRVAIAVIPTASGIPTHFFETDVDDVDEAGSCIVKEVRRVTHQ